MSLLLLFNQPIGAATDAGSSTVVLLPAGAETIRDAGSVELVLVPSGTEETSGFVATSGTAGIALSASAAEAIADRSRDVFQSGVFQSGVFQQGPRIRLRPSGVGVASSGVEIVGGGFVPLYEPPEPVRRRGTVRVEIGASGTAVLGELATVELRLEIAAAASLRAEGASRAVLRPGGRRALGVAVRTRVRLRSSGLETVAGAGTGRAELDATGTGSREWAREAEDELLLLV